MLLICQFEASRRADALGLYVNFEHNSTLFRLPVSCKVKGCKFILGCAREIRPEFNGSDLVLSQINVVCHSSPQMLLLVIDELIMLWVR